MARPRKVPEGADQAIGDLSAIVARFQAEFPDDWEALRLCPLQHGLEDMARLLK